MVRIDYMPSCEAQAVLQAMRVRQTSAVLATNSAVLNAILFDWAKQNEIGYVEAIMAMTSASFPEFNDRSARAYDFGNRPQCVPCGARRHRDGQPCEARPEPGKSRCRFHGGRSTGPRTEGGKARSLANLRRGREVRG